MAAMSARAPQLDRTRRRPLNLAATDVKRAIEHQPNQSVRDLIEHYRSRVLAQEQIIEEGSRILCINPKHPRAINAVGERAKLAKMQDLLHHLVQLYQLLNLPTREDVNEPPTTGADAESGS